MKQLFVLSGLMTLAMVSQSTPLLSENFNSYTPGNLVGQGGWTITSTSVVNPLAVTSAGTVSMANNGQDGYDSLSSAISNVGGSSVYIGLDLNLSGAGTGDYFLHLSTLGGTTSNFFDKLFAKATTGGYLLGVSDNAPASTAYGSTILNFGTFYHVVLAMDFVTGAKNDTFEVYVNPTDRSVVGNNTPYTTFTWTSSTAEPSSLAAVGLRQGVASAAPTLTVDNLTVSQTFSDTTVPEPTTLALIGAGAGLLVLINRRRK